MKKIVALILCLTLSFSLIACGSGTDINPEIIIDEINPFDKESIGIAGTVAVDETKDAFNRLTGEYNIARDREKSRPVAIAVNNITYAIPQYGISLADFVIEMETEGGITRLMCVFGDTRDLEMVGSVRSLRDQFMQILLPIDALIVHIGKSVYAERFMSQYNYLTLDGDVTGEAVSVNNEIAAQRDSEHSWFTSGLEIQTGMELAGLDLETAASDVTLFNFIEVDAEKVVPTSGTADQITFDFSSGYDGDFRYDAETGKYLKFQHGDAQIDAGNDNTQLAFENVFVLLADITEREDAPLLIDVDYVQGGTGYYLTQGAYQEINWSKTDASASFVFTDAATGEEIQVNTGKSFLGVIRTTLEDTLKIS